MPRILMVATVILFAVAASAQTTSAQKQSHPASKPGNPKKTRSSAKASTSQTKSEKPAPGPTAAPLQPVINNNIINQKQGVDWSVEALKLLPTVLAGLFGYWVAMQGVDKKAQIDEEVEGRRQMANLHKERADALSSIIGMAFTFAAAAERTNAALRSMASHAFASNLDEKRQDYFAERSKLRGAAALLLAEAEKYGKLPSSLNLKNEYLTNYVHDWSDSVERKANEAKDEPPMFLTEAYAIVGDLRKLKEFEESEREAKVTNQAPKKSDLDGFEWLID